MDKRFALFLALSTAILALNIAITVYMVPPRDDRQQAQGKPQPAADAAKQKAPAAKLPKDAEPAAAEPAVQEAGRESPATARWVSLGSLDAKSPYRMLVTLTSEGAAIERVELNSPRFRELEDRSGYLGHLCGEKAPGGGCKVRVVGLGTPAAKAGLRVGDVIRSVEGKSVGEPSELARVLESTKPRQSVRLNVERGDKRLKLTAQMIRRPLDVIRPEYNLEALDVVSRDKHDPFSMLLSLERIDHKSREGRDEELAGAELAKANWQVQSADEDSATFRKVLPDYKLEVLKHYRLAKVPNSTVDDPNAPAYHLTFSIEIRNTGNDAHDLAYRLEGPTGLTLEGWWYASKMSHTWSAAGMRDVIMQFEGNQIHQTTPIEIANGKAENHTDAALNFIAVDGQYFAAALLPEARDRSELVLASVKAIAAGTLPEETREYRLTNTSFSLVSQDQKLGKNETLKKDFQLFIGPKRPDLLSEYGPPQARLDLLVNYGWFGWVARPMLSLLHFFHDHLVHHYALAIIMLTVLVRGCMFPLSRKQALSAQKMQELQPELKRITEKFKNNTEAKTRAQQELFRKHNYNPLGGCLLMFIQLPIFIGLYRSLMVDVELRQAPLITEAIRWGSNLGAPDMLMDWTGFMPSFITSSYGILGLGPYLNVLPLVTIALFIWQQKMFMPPPADEQAAVQQKMMQVMMIFMGVMFFKVASGLCLYFIASSIWGIAERKLLPKTGAGAGPIVPRSSPASSPGNGSPAGQGRKKQRERK